MALQRILGGSGSGKTTYLQDKIIGESLKYPEQMYFMIVPEQFTMQTQKDVVTRHPKHGTMNIDIVSFQRLAYRIFEELAVENLQILDDMGKSMVLRKVAANHKKELVLFQGHLNQTGFVNQLKSMVSEFYQYGITPEILREMAPLAKTPRFRQKLEDFAVVFQGFQDYIEGHYITTEEVLDVLCRVIPRSELIRNSVIALDGYTGFTPVQYRLIELFLVYAKQVIVTITADDPETFYRPMGMQQLFYMSHQMADRLGKLAEKNQVRQLKDIWMEYVAAPRFMENPELSYLEKHLFRYQKEPYAGEMQGAVELYQAATPSAEVAQVVHRIQEMLQTDGLRYRDIAVITGDLERYGKEIAHQFTQNGIPHFMDDKKTVLDHPLVELIRAALEVVQRDFSYESVFRYLRTGLVTTDWEMTDRMENYVLALGIRGGKRWAEDWERTYRGAGNLNLVELNAWKKTVIAPLLQMQKRFRAEAVTIVERIDAIRELLTAGQIEQKLSFLEQYFQSQEEYRLAKEYSQLYVRVMELFDRYEELLGEEQVGRKEFAEILDAGFAEISVGVIPATVDRIVVGDITRTRLAHIQVLFFVGVNDGIVPMRKDGGSLLSDLEREFFHAHELELAPTAREDSFQQRFYLYLLMTKPSKKLIVSYANVGNDGKSIRPSYLIAELKKMFPNLICKKEQEKQTVYSVAEAKKQVIAGLRQAAEYGLENSEEEREFLRIYHWFFDSDEYREDVKKLVDAAFYVYEQKGISHAVAQALYGKILSGSVTRLERYAACAYGHFLQYGLELLERPKYELASADIGNLFHDSIERCFAQAKEQGWDWRSMTDEARVSLVHQCVESVTAEYGNTIFDSTSRNAYLARRVEQMTQRTVWALQQQLKRGDFSPVGFEVSFSAADHLEAMKIALSEDEAIHLRGRIDRLDLYEDEEHIYVKIIDYKSGNSSFDLVALYYGLQLQLVVYMDAMMELTGRKHPEKEIVPAGMLYYNIADPVIQKEGKQDPEKIEAEILRALKMKGLINSELETIRHLDHTIEKESDIIPVVLKGEEVQIHKSSVANTERFAVLRSYVQKKIQTAGREILDGAIGTAPYKNGTRTACDYCPYHAVCGFDKKTAGYDYRRLKTMKAEEVWEELCQQ